MLCGILVCRAGKRRVSLGEGQEGRDKERRGRERGARTVKPPL
jgi:hypothetical protein